MRKFLPVILLFFSIPLALSQETYKGEYVFNGLSGYAEFQFKTGPEDNIIKHGDFEFFRKNIDFLNNNRLVKNQVTGNFTEDLKSGNWQYINEQHDIFLKDVINMSVLADLVSNISNLRASYRNGVPHGNWSLNTRQYDNNQMNPKASADRIVFSEGYVTSDFQFKEFEGSRTLFINGKLSESGEMDGEWTMVYSQDTLLVSEVRNYEQGFLLGLVRRDLETDDLLDEVVYFSTIEKLDQIKNNKNEGFEISERKFGLRYNDGFRQIAKEYRSQQSGNNYIENFLKQLLQFEQGEYIDDSGELVKYPIYTRRFVFELSKEEESRLKEIPQIFEQLKLTTANYVDMNALALNRSKLDSLAFAYRYFQVNQEKFENFENLINIIESDRFRYFDISNYLGDGLEYFTMGDTISYTFNEDTLQRIVPTINLPLDPDNFLQDFSTYLKEELDRARTLGNYVEGELDIIKQDDGLQKLEAQILERLDEVDSLYRSHKPYNVTEGQLMHNISSNFLTGAFDRLIKEYADQEDYSKKIRESERILDLLSEMEKQFPRLIKIFPAMDVLDELYLEEIFNPFTYTRYDQRVKERLYQNGAEKLFDHYLTQLSQEDDYTEIKEWISKIEALYNRMVELRNQETRKLERRLRSNLAISRIETLLNL